MDNYFIVLTKMSFNAVVQYLQERFGETYQVDTLVFLVTIQGFLVFAFVVAAFFVAGTANAGFNCVLTAFLNMAVTLGGYYVIKHSRAPIAVSTFFPFRLQYLPPPSMDFS